MADQNEHRAAVEAGYAPLSDYVGEKAFPPSVFIPDDIWKDFECYAKRTGCETETAIVAALSEWLGRV